MATKKIYEQIAARLARIMSEIPSHTKTSELQRGAVRSVAFSLADVLADDNPRFSRERFLLAARCELGNNSPV